MAILRRGHFKILKRHSLKEKFCIYFFRPRTHPKTFLQCFALAQRESKAKHCRNVLGHVVGRIDWIQKLSFRALKTLYLKKK